MKGKISVGTTNTIYKVEAYERPRRISMHCLHAHATVCVETKKVPGSNVISTTCKVVCKNKYCDGVSDSDALRILARKY